MLKKIFNSRGFSIIQVMVLAGILGASSIVVMQQFKDTKSNQKGKESDQDIERMMTRIQTEFLSVDGCKKNLSSSTPKSLTQILARTTGEVIATVNTNNPMGAFFISGMNLELKSKDTTTGISDSFLVINFEKRQQNIGTSLKVTKKIPIHMKEEGSTVKWCYADMDEYIKKQLKANCDTLGPLASFGTSDCILQETKCASETASARYFNRETGAWECKSLDEDVIPVDKLVDTKPTDCTDLSKANEMNLHLTGTSTVAIFCGPPPTPTPIPPVYCTSCSKWNSWSLSGANIIKGPDMCVKWPVKIRWWHSTCDWNKTCKTLYPAGCIVKDTWGISSASDQTNTGIKSCGAIATAFSQVYWFNLCYTWNAPKW